MTDTLQKAADELAYSNRDGTLNLDRAAIANSVIERIEDVVVTQHPLGFFHYELTPLVSIEDARLRFHVWSDRTMQGVDRFGLKHDHVWRLTSFVLIGTLTDVVYNLENDSAADYRVLSVSYLGESDRLTPTGGRFRCEEIGRRTVRAGDVYHLPPCNFHESNVSDPPVATIVFAAGGAKGSPRIVSREQLQAAMNVERVTIDRATAKVELLSVLEAIEKS